MSDLFHGRVPLDFVRQVFSVMLVQIGRFAVAGFAEEQTAFGLRDEGRDP